MSTTLLEPREVTTATPRRPHVLDGRGDLAAAALVAMTVTTFLEVLRVLMPVEWAKEPDLGLVVAVAAYPLLFLAPLLAPGLRRLTRGSVVPAVVGLAVARLLIDALPASFPLVVTAAAVVLVCTVPVLVAAAGRVNGPAVVTLGIISGFALDGAIRGAFRTWDRAFHLGVSTWLVGLTFVVALVVAGVAASRAGVVATGEPEQRGVSSLAVVGMLLGAQVLFLQSPAYVASAADLTLPWAVFTVVGGGALALAVAGAVLRRPLPLVGVTAAVLLAMVVLACPTATGDWVPALVLAGQLLTAVVIAVALAHRPAEHVATVWRSGLGLAVGLLASFAALVLYQVHYENPLPFPNTLVMPAVVLMAAAVLASTTLRRRAPEFVVPTRLLTALGVAVAVVAASVGGSLAATARQASIAASGTWPLRVLTFNIGMGVSPDGQVRLGEIRDAIVDTKADVVVLEEVSRGWPLGGTQDVGAWFAHELGWQQVWAPAADNQYGNLLLSRIRLHDATALDLPKGGGSMKRSAVLARIDVEGTSVLVIGAHLQHRNTAASMQARQDELAVLLRAWGQEPNTVLLGDLNPRNPDLRDLSTLTSAGFTTTQGTTRCTAPTSNDNCSDYVFVGPGLAQSPPVEVLDTDLSDHRLVVSTITRAGS
jgi:endonuclease/exonuclease/phosphatase family metal-dependent hydrolase